MKYPCKFMEQVQEGNKLIPYCIYGRYRNRALNIDSGLKIRILDKGHPCPWLEACPHEGEVWTIVPQ